MSIKMPFVCKKLVKRLLPLRSVDREPFKGQMLMQAKRVF